MTSPELPTNLGMLRNKQPGHAQAEHPQTSPPTTQQSPQNSGPTTSRFAQFIPKPTQEESENANNTGQAGIGTGDAECAEVAAEGSPEAAETGTQSGSPASDSLDTANGNDQPQVAPNPFGAANAQQSEAQSKPPVPASRPNNTFARSAAQQDGPAASPQAPQDSDPLNSPDSLNLDLDINSVSANRGIGKRAKDFDADPALAAEAAKLGASVERNCEGLSESEISEYSEALGYIRMHIDDLELAKQASAHIAQLLSEKPHLKIMIVPEDIGLITSIFRKRRDAKVGTITKRAATKRKQESEDAQVADFLKDFSL